MKPANILVDAQDRVHLMDFGLAARADDESEAKLTSDGAVMGTPAYMAPEQAQGQQGDVKPSTDQYACGVVLYELLTGRAPFTGPIPVVLHNVVHTDPERPSELRTGIPMDLETICQKAMAKRPEDRYSNCQELADDLRRWLEGDPIGGAAAVVGGATGAMGAEEPVGGDRGRPLRRGNRRARGGVGLVDSVSHRAASARPRRGGDTSSLGGDNARAHGGSRDGGGTQQGRCGPER